MQCPLALAEMSLPYVVKATREGWDMASTLETRATWRWNNNVPFLHTLVIILWSLLDFRPAKFPMTKWMRFNVRTTEDFFSVPR
jgi:hypothetical protein